MEFAPWFNRETLLELSCGADALPATTIDFSVIRTHKSGILTIESWSLPTSHASIAYRKQLPPQRIVGTIGSVWQKSTPSKETKGPAQTNTQSTNNAMKVNSRKCQTAHARP